MKVLIAIPSMDTVPAQFRQSLAMLQKEGECYISFQIGSLVYTSRNRLSETAISLGTDYVLWLDSDMVFAPDLMVSMLKTLKENDLDILTGVYFRRVAPFTPVIYDEMRLTENGSEQTEFKTLPEGLFKVGACGFGCVLMKTEVLADTLSRTGDLFSPINSVGEDISFCIRRRDCGYEIYADPSIVLGHIGHRTITRRYWESLNK